MLRKLRKDGHKVLIFSQFVSALQVLQDYFELVGPKVLGEYRYLSGESKAQDRDDAIFQFNNDKEDKIFAFLLSTRAGGLGINLVAADTVIFYDSDWNPKSDEQAMDRAHRIGQVRPVVVYRLVTEGASVERYMIRKAAAKAGLGRMILKEGIHRFGEGEGSDSSEEDTTAGVFGKHEDGLLADALSTSPAGLQAPPEGSGKRSKYGQISMRLLNFWLRDDFSDARILSSGGIKDAELYAILDRARALQAGKRAADAVEKQLLLEASGEAPIADDAAPEVGTGGDDKKRTKRDLAEAVSTPSPKPSRSSKKEKESAVAKEETVSWEEFAASAPYTPSVGDGYEFVYHESSRGLIPARLSKE
jgi:hypothetical protein